jgi:hypothetical protein
LYGQALVQPEVKWNFKGVATMLQHRISMKDFEHPTEEELEKYRQERKKESEGGRKGGQHSHQKKAKQ